MSISRALLAALCLTSLILTGCSKNSSNNQSNAQMRVVNAFSQANALDVTVNAKPVVSGLPFQSNSQYTDVDSGSQTVIVSVTGASTSLVNTIYNLSGNTKYSYVIFGPQTAVGAQLLTDSFNDPGDGFFSMRLVNAAAGPGALDLYLTAPGADLSATAPAIANVAYGSSSLFVPIAKGTSFEIRITPAGTKDVIYDGVPQTFAEHSGASDRRFRQGQRQAGQRRSAAGRRRRIGRAGRQPVDAIQGGQCLAGSLRAERARRRQPAAVEHPLYGRVELSADQHRERTISASRRRPRRARPC